MQPGKLLRDNRPPIVASENSRNILNFIFPDPQIYATNDLVVCSFFPPDELSPPQHPPPPPPPTLA
ncbi:hypothetical protein PFDG_04891 [Plasmodium falciparum Dd2]|uniref:Uncharacterized protein n=1 Tax=Plasmodium falciparum (isolate Dd2) TaxID=57267 RepID=A0A0L7M919_PLAF4|nr:hypothetical protein PFDG_04891 [Plasmodium falciparum Dd2]